MVNRSAPAEEDVRTDDDVCVDAEPALNVCWPARAASRAGLDHRSRIRGNRPAHQIVETALRLVGEKGSGFTIQELARAAGFSLQTFYRYFAGKEELILAMIEQRIAEACVDYRRRAVAFVDPIERLRFFVTDTIGLLADEASLPVRRFMTSEHYRTQEIFPEELARATSAFQHLLVPEIESARATGRLAATDAEQSAWFVNQLVMATFHHYSFAESGRPPADLADQLWTFCYQALGGTASA